MAETDDTLARYSIAAIRTAAEQLDTDPLALARQLQDGQIARLVRLLNSAHRHVSTPGLRHRIEDVLSSASGGTMPMFEAAETELDWAMGELRQRRTERERHGPGDGSEP